MGKPENTDAPEDADLPRCVAGVREPADQP